jgi:hypothetical protein
MRATTRFMAPWSYRRHQFTSDDQILAAAAAGQITLTPTSEIYRCSVIGPNKS